jgi:hypothetical protein
LSVELAVRVMVDETLAPFGGAVITTDGGVVSVPIAKEMV